MQIYTWDKTGYESAYWKQYYKQLGCGAARAKNCACAERDISYSREFFENDRMFALRAENIVNRLNLEASTDIMVIGCGLGLLMEELKNLGMNCWGCDDSHYIQTIKNREKAKFPIHNISVTDASFVNKIRNATGAMWFDVVITEDVLTSHDSYTTIFNNCDSILNPSVAKTNVLHIVDTNCTAPMVRKTLSEWTSLNTQHSWANVVGGTQ